MTCRGHIEGSTSVSMALGIGRTKAHPGGAPDLRIPRAIQKTNEAGFKNVGVVCNESSVREVCIACDVRKVCRVYRVCANVCMH